MAVLRLFPFAHRDGSHNNTSVGALARRLHLTPSCPYHAGSLSFAAGTRPPSYPGWDARLEDILSGSPVALVLVRIFQLDPSPSSWELRRPDA